MRKLTRKELRHRLAQENIREAIEALKRIESDLKYIKPSDVGEIPVSISSISQHVRELEASIAKKNDEIAEATRN